MDLKNNKEKYKEMNWIWQDLDDNNKPKKW